MAFIKAHMIPLICAVAAILAAVAYFVWPLPGYSASLQSNAGDRLKLIDNFKAAEHQPLSIPGVPSSELSNGAITDQIINEKRKVQGNMKDDAVQINAEASRDNEAGRIIRQADGKTEIPLLDGIPEPNYLPFVTNNADTNDFSEAYLRTFDRWITLLATGSKTSPGFDPIHGSSAPDKAIEIDPVWAIREKARLAALPQFAPQPGVVPVVEVPNPTDPKFIRNFINQRASSIRMYVNRDSFQVRRPTSIPVQIFEAFVDSFLQGDVVHSIDAINAAVLAKELPEDRNVGHSPIKRLIRITVGAGAGSDAMQAMQATLFMASPGQAGVDFSKSMTGRTGTSEYDVTNMDIVMDIDPSYINRFIAMLYKQNNGYTVVGMKLSAVDPFVAASNGYIYGSGQVVTVDLRVEALLFKGWTAGIKPADYGTAAAGTAAPMPGGHK